MKPSPFLIFGFTKDFFKKKEKTVLPLKKILALILNKHTKAMFFNLLRFINELFPHLSTIRDGLLSQF
jgi:hypothetical protein